MVRSASREKIVVESRTINFIGWVGISLFVLCGAVSILTAGLFGYHVECESPREDEIALAFGVRNLWLHEADAPNSAQKVAAIFGRRKDLHVFARRTPTGDEVVIEPVHCWWSACRPTIVVFDHGKKSR
jgi:hypothetical protein